MSTNGGGFKTLRRDRVSAKEIEAEQVVPVRFERQRVNRGDWVEAQRVGLCGKDPEPTFLLYFFFPSQTSHRLFQPVAMDTPQKRI